MAEMSTGETINLCVGVRWYRYMLGWRCSKYDAHNFLDKYPLPYRLVGVKRYTGTPVYRNTGGCIEIQDTLFEDKIRIVIRKFSNFEVQPTEK